MLSCHHCDNPPCCNPNGTEHLFLGTPKDNSDDMLAKDRAARGDRHPSRLLPGYLPVGDGHHARKTPEVMARGERNGASVLTEELVREILRRHAVGDSIYRMAKEYQVSKGTVRFVVQRKTWRHVDYPGGVAFRMSETSAHTLIVEATK
jgi:hypothetical protein